MTKQESIELLKEKVKDVRMAMLTTMTKEGDHVARPMATQEMGPDGTIWFLTSAESGKVKDISINPKVGISYSDSSSELYVSISGIAKVSNDRELIKKFWNPFYKAWFESESDPSIRVIEVEPTSAEYWDTKGGKVVSLISMALSAVTGKDFEAGENKEIKL